MEPQERKMYTMMQQARTIRNDKVLKRKAKKMEKRAKKRKIMEREKNKFAEHHREAKKKMYIKAGKERMSRLNGGHKASSNKDRNNTQKDSRCPTKKIEMIFDCDYFDCEELNIYFVSVRR